MDTKFLRSGPAPGLSMRLVLKRPWSGYSDGQRLLKGKCGYILKRAKLLSNVLFLCDGVAIANGEKSEYADQVMIAQAADTLLSMEGVSLPSC